eukprot:gene337-604_t
MLGNKKILVKSFFIFCGFLSVNSLLQRTLFTKFYSSSSSYYTRSVSNRLIYALTDSDDIVSYNATPQKEFVAGNATGKGEWTDWDNDAYLEDPVESFDEDSDDESLPSFSLLSSFGTVASLDPKSYLNRRVGAVIPKNVPIVEDPLPKGLELQLPKRTFSGEETTVPVEGRGEWTDWAQDASYYDDPYESDDEGGGDTSLSANNKPDLDSWNEEAPYFDENDFCDDQGNIGRAEHISNEFESRAAGWDPRVFFVSVHLCETTTSTAMGRRSRMLLPLLAFLLDEIGRPWQVSRVETRDVETSSGIDVVLESGKMVLPLTPATLRYLSRTSGGSGTTDRLKDDKQSLYIDRAVEQLEELASSKDPSGGGHTAAALVQSIDRVLGHVSVAKAGNEEFLGCLAVFAAVRNIRQGAPPVDPMHSEEQGRLNVFMEQMEIRLRSSGLLDSWLTNQP